MYRYEKLARKHAEAYGIELDVTDSQGDYTVEAWSGGSGYELDATECHTSIVGSEDGTSPAGVWRLIWDDIKHLSPCREAARAARDGWCPAGCPSA